MLRTLALCLALAADLSAQVRVRTADRTLTLDVEDYVAAVVSAEAGGITSTEALHACAVVARTYARAFHGRHASQGYDFCNTTHCQSANFSRPLRAPVELTSGLCLWYRGRAAHTYYHHDCGGRTASAEEVWPGAGRPYLISVDDSPWHNPPTWDTSLPPADLARALGLDSITSLEVRRRSPAGRVVELAIDGRPVGAEQFQLSVGRTLGWNKLRSRMYSVEDFVFRGSGAGHGVGLCQDGAQGRGRAGQNYRQILAAYYPGTILGLTPAGLEWTRLMTERTEVWTLAAPPPDFAAMADRAALRAEHLAGWKFLERPRARIFPTVALYRDLTGEPGFVAASTRGRDVRLQLPVRPPTLTHEFIHVLLNQRARKPLPLWFEEGLALCLSGPDSSATGNAALLEAPRNEAELRIGYAGAQARVKALLAQYGRPGVLAWLATGLPKNLPR